MLLVLLTRRKLYSQVQGEGTVAGPGETSLDLLHPSAHPEARLL